MLSQYQVMKRYGWVTLIHRMNKFQKELLKTLGLSEAKVKEEIKTMEAWE